MFHPQLSLTDDSSSDSSDAEGTDSDYPGDEYESIQEAKKRL